MIRSKESFIAAFRDAETNNADDIKDTYDYFFKEYKNHIPNLTELARALEYLMNDWYEGYGWDDSYTKLYYDLYHYKICEYLDKFGIIPHLMRVVIDPTD